MIDLLVSFVVAAQPEATTYTEKICEGSRIHYTTSLIVGTERPPKGHPTSRTTLAVDGKLVEDIVIYEDTPAPRKPDHELRFETSSGLNPETRLAVLKKGQQLAREKVSCREETREVAFVH